MILPHDGAAQPTQKFSLGRIFATPAALAVLTPQDILLALNRHAVGDWGDVSNDDKEANERALKDGSRLFSVYISANGVRFWVITEADRSATTAMLPEDY